METYKNLVKEILHKGKSKGDRTGTGTISRSGTSIEHDMSKGFPVLTTKYVPLQVVAVELEGFIKGITSKKWYQDRKCKIWNEWCNKQNRDYQIRIADGINKNEAALMCGDLGPIYGYQWRFWGRSYINIGDPALNCTNGLGGIDQLKKAIELLKSNPLSRQNLISAWNPKQIDQMALPPCHDSFQLISDGETLDLIWRQRSVDVALGLPFNIASYAMLMLLVCREANMTPGRLVGHFGDTHIYKDHLYKISEQIERDTYKLPALNITGESTNIFDWKHTDFICINYLHHNPITYPISV